MKINVTTLALLLGSAALAQAQHTVINNQQLGSGNIVLASSGASTIVGGIANGDAVHHAID
jgi:hypothetical protein